MGIVNFWKTVLNREKPKKKRSPAKSKKRMAKTPRKATRKPTKKRPKNRKLQPKTKTKTKIGKPKEKEIGVITHYFNKISVGIVKLKTGLRVGDAIHIKGLHDDFSQNVDSMQLDHQNIVLAKRGDEIGIKVIKRVHENDKVYTPLNV
jgi:putative protease